MFLSESLMFSFTSHAASDRFDFGDVVFDCGVLAKAASLLYKQNRKGKIYNIATWTFAVRTLDPWLWCPVPLPKRVAVSSTPGRVCEGQASKPTAASSFFHDLR
jgi:hypothetical protein